jgi:hypothetical protein
MVSISPSREPLESCFRQVRAILEREVSGESDQLSRRVSELRDAAMSRSRRERISQALRDEISGLLRKEIRDPAWASSRSPAPRSARI